MDGLGLICFFGTSCIQSWPLKDEDSPLRCLLILRYGAPAVSWALPRGCWAPCDDLLRVISDDPPVSINLHPEHILIIEALPSNWETPLKFQQTMRALMCWLDWKTQTCIYFRRSEVQRISRMAWHSLCLDLHIAWKNLMIKVRKGSLSLIEAMAQMAMHYGREGKFWSLHEVTLLVPRFHQGLLTFPVFGWNRSAYLDAATGDMHSLGGPCLALPANQSVWDVASPCRPLLNPSFSSVLLDSCWAPALSGCAMRPFGPGRFGFLLL